MDKLAAHLIEKETISGKEFMKIYRKEKGLPEPEEKEEEKEEHSATETQDEQKTADSEKKEDAVSEENPTVEADAQERVTGRFSNVPSDFF